MCSHRNLSQPCLVFREKSHLAFLNFTSTSHSSMPTNVQSTSAEKPVERAMSAEKVPAEKIHDKTRKVDSLFETSRGRRLSPEEIRRNSSSLSRDSPHPWLPAVFCTWCNVKCPSAYNLHQVLLKCAYLTFIFLFNFITIVSAGTACHRITI